MLVTANRLFCHMKKPQEVSRSRWSLKVRTGARTVKREELEPKIGELCRSLGDSVSYREK
jgi:hypothetical protein